MSIWLTDFLAALHPLVTLYHIQQVVSPSTVFGSSHKYISLDFLFVCLFMPHIQSVNMSSLLYLQNIS